MHGTRQAKTGVRRSAHTGLALALALVAFGASSALPARANEDYTDLDLFELSALSAEVTSVSGRPQRLIEAPAAIAVIDAEDIRRSGHTSVPELLRMVPGIHVARVNTNVWAISARGFTNEFANKLLVMIDGRVIYTPAFSGVYWNMHDVAPEDIERIEVIRGPGATIWGTNAVNGVINIITKSANDTRGDFVRVLAGSEDRGLASFRFGREVSPTFRYRVSGRAFARDPSVNADGHKMPDEWTAQRTAFRADWQSGRHGFTFDTSGFSSHAGRTVTNFPPDVFVLGNDFSSEETDLARGGHGLFRWREDQSDGGVRQFQAYYDLQHMRGKQFDEIRHSVHGNYQQELAAQGAHSLIWGAGYRFTTNRISRSLVVEPSNDDRADAFWSAFLQDEIELAERVHLALGSKVEWNDLAGWEFQPSARLLFTPRDNHQLWLSLSRATRSPSNVERDVALRISVVGPNALTGPTPVTVGTLQDEHFRSEVLLATEAGYRFQPRPNMALDFAVFFNDYENLRRVTERPFPFLLVPIDNRANGRTFGGELALDWRATGWLSLTASYAQLRADFTNGLLDEENAPEDRWQVRSSFDLPGNVELDAGVEYTSALISFPGTPVDHYFRVDSRIAWKPSKRLELSLVGQNLLDRQHREWTAFLGGNRNIEIQRNVYAQVVWSY
jgi:iron complex outermembrane recepter protein